MSTAVEAFDLGRELGRDGAFVRQQSAFRELVSADGSSGLRAEPGRYHLYVSPACPWSHRAIIVRKLGRLEDVVSLSQVDPVRDGRGWAFTGGPFTDPVNEFSFLREAYVRTDPSFDGRASVPVLWDRETQRVINNESSEIMRMLGSAFQEWGGDRLDLYPPDLRSRIDGVNEFVYEHVNNGVYRAGFATRQEIYDAAFDALFAALDELEQRLTESRYLAGERLTEADWRLWVTLVRFDAVYYVHFKCNRRRLTDYPSLWDYTRALYQHAGIGETVEMDQIKRHYYLTHPAINPSRIIPRGPELDFGAPHTRG